MATSRRLRSGGFTLLELLIALTIGLAVIATVLAVYVSSSRSSQLSQAETQLNEDGILALNLVQQQLKVAGYSRQIIPNNGASVMGNFSGAAVRGCDGGFKSGTDAFGSIACSSKTDDAASDAIAIRYEATLENTNPTSATPSAPTNCINNGINAADASQAAPVPSPAPGNYALADNRYMVTNPTTQPMLSCQGNEKNLTANAIGTSQPLLANVENIQILYGVARLPSAELAATYDPMRHQIVSYLSASQIDALVASGTLLDATDDRWGRVLSVRVCLLMRSDQTVRDVPPGGFAYKDCKNIDATGTDGYLRKTYTTTVLLRNRLLIQ